jgi:polyferredoxin
MTFWIGYRKYRRLKSELLSIFYRDGLAFFFLISGMQSLALLNLSRLFISVQWPVSTVGNILCNLLGPVSVLSKFYPPELTSIDSQVTSTSLQCKLVNPNAILSADKRNSPQRVIHSILSSRMILHLREENRWAYESRNGEQITEIRYAASVEMDVRGSNPEQSTSQSQYVLPS